MREFEYICANLMIVNLALRYQNKCATENMINAQRTFTNDKVAEIVSRLLALVVALLLSKAASAAELPNVLWITCEDIGPHLRCYGDDYATTPNLDGLAAKGMRYTNAISNAPVCAPARTT